MMKARRTISIDGPSASGKTTLGMALAQRYRAMFLDTGLTYRALALALSRKQFFPGQNKLPSIIKHCPLVYRQATAENDSIIASDERLFVEGVDVTDDLFVLGLESHLNHVSASPQWRSEILAYHNQLILAHENVVAVGRDAGTNLMPNATFHVILTARLSVRRERRRAQYRANSARSITVGPSSELDKTTLELLRALPNSILIDTSFLPKEAVLQAVRTRMERT